MIANSGGTCLLDTVPLLLPARASPARYLRGPRPSGGLRGQRRPKAYQEIVEITSQSTAGEEAAPEVDGGDGVHGDALQPALPHLSTTSTHASGQGKAPPDS